MVVSIKGTLRDYLKALIGPVTRLRTKRFKETFNGLLQYIWNKVYLKKILNNKLQALINLVHFKKIFIGRQSNKAKR